MESLLFLLNSAAMAILVIMGLRDDRRRPDIAAKSYFRYIEEAATSLDGAETNTRRKLPARKPVQGRGP